jgi:hypothetical protein
MHSNYQGSTHKSVHTQALGRRVAAKAQELRLREHLPNHDAGQEASPKQVPDLCASGRHKVASSLLATFNKKVCDLIDGKAPITKDDEVPVLQFAEDETNAHDAGDEDDEANE